MSLQSPRSPRQKQILDAARALVLQGGVQSLTIAELSQKSNASVGSLYHHFKSKEGVVMAVRDDALAHYRAGQSRALELRENPSKDVKRVVKTLVRVHFDHAYHLPDDAQILAATTDADALIPKSFLREVLNDAALDRQIEDIPFAMVPALLLGPISAMLPIIKALNEKEASIYRDLFARGAWRNLRKR